MYLDGGNMGGLGVAHTWGAIMRWVVLKIF